MNKKIFIFGIVGVIAILLAILTLRAFSLKSDNKKNKEAMTVKDFAEISTSDDYKKKLSSKTKIVKEDVENLENNSKSSESIDSNDSSSSFSSEDLDEYNKNNELIDSLGDLGDVPITDIYSEEVLQNIQNLLDSGDAADYSNVKVATQNDVSFLYNITQAADNYVLAYDEAQSFVLTSDMSALSDFVAGSFTDVIEDFEKIDTYNDSNFENIKQIYLDGMYSTKDGFIAYINNPQSEDCNKYFLNADSKFYEGQQELKELLSDYTLE